MEAYRPSPRGNPGGWPERDAPDDPARSVIESLPAWPPESFYALAHALGNELARRHIPVPAALPIADIMGAIQAAPIGVSPA